MTPISRKILFVDDEPNVLEGLRRQLRRRYEIFTALSGTDGLELLRHEGPFALVISDYNMPGMTGVQFLQQVRLTGLYTFVSRLNMLDCADDVARLVVETASQMLESGRVSLMLPGQDREYLRVAAAVGIPPDVAGQVRVPVGAMIAGRVFADA